MLVTVAARAEDTLVLALSRGGGRIGDAIAEAGLPRDVEVLTLAEARAAAGRGHRPATLVVAGAPPEEDIGYGLVPLVVMGLRPGRVALLDVRDGSLRSRSRARFLARAAAPAAAQMAVAATALVGQRALAAYAGRRRDGVTSPELRGVLYVRGLSGTSTGVGGSVTHAHGVIEGLGRIGIDVVPITTDRAIAATAEAQERPPCRWRVVRIPRIFKALPASTALGGDLALLRAAGEAAESCDVIYQRHGRFTLAGPLLAKRTGKPLFLEFNGSQIFFTTAWQPTPFARQVAVCEKASLAAAARIIVVSEVERDNLIRRGVSPERIVVNPNGVDTERFAQGGGPDVRRRLGLDGALVAGFVGSFGPWHGAPVLAEAFAMVAQRVPELQLLLIGTGPESDRTRMVLEQHGVLDRCRFTGAVPPAEVPGHLDACDILVSPHVPLPGDIPFFGSPTKLFEYMAAGKPIVASALGQIADVLTDGQTALLVTPGAVDELALGLERLARSPELRVALGAAAREQAVERHTWARNAEVIAAAYRDWAAQAEGRPAIQ